MHRLTCADSPALSTPASSSAIPSVQSSVTGPSLHCSESSLDSLSLTSEGKSFSALWEEVDRYVVPRLAENPHQLPCVTRILQQYESLRLEELAYILAFCFRSSADVLLCFSLFFPDSLLLTLQSNSNDLTAPLCEVIQKLAPEKYFIFSRLLQQILFLQQHKQSRRAGRDVQKHQHQQQRLLLQREQQIDQQKAARETLLRQLQALFHDSPLITRVLQRLLLQPSCFERIFDISIGVAPLPPELPIETLRPREDEPLHLHAVYRLAEKAATHSSQTPGSNNTSFASDILHVARMHLGGRISFTSFSREIDRLWCGFPLWRKYAVAVKQLIAALCKDRHLSSCQTPSFLTQRKTTLLPSDAAVRGETHHRESVSPRTACSLFLEALARSSPAVRLEFDHLISSSNDSFRQHSSSSFSSSSSSSSSFTSSFSSSSSSSPSSPSSFSSSSSSSSSSCSSHSSSSPSSSFSCSSCCCSRCANSKRVITTAAGPSPPAVVTLQRLASMLIQEHQHESCERLGVLVGLFHKNEEETRRSLMTVTRETASAAAFPERFSAGTATSSSTAVSTTCSGRPLLLPSHSSTTATRSSSTSSSSTSTPQRHVTLLSPCTAEAHNNNNNKAPTQQAVVALTYTPPPHYQQVPIASAITTTTTPATSPAQAAAAAAGALPLPPPLLLPTFKNTPTNTTLTNTTTTTTNAETTSYTTATGALPPPPTPLVLLPTFNNTPNTTFTNTATTTNTDTTTYTTATTTTNITPAPIPTPTTSTATSSAITYHPCAQEASAFFSTGATTTVGGGGGLLPSAARCGGEDPLNINTCPVRRKRGRSVSVYEHQIRTLLHNTSASLPQAQEAAALAREAAAVAAGFAAAAAASSSSSSSSSFGGDGGGSAFSRFRVAGMRAAADAIAPHLVPARCRSQQQLLDLVGLQWLSIIYIILDEWSAGLFTKQQAVEALTYISGSESRIRTALRPLVSLLEGRKNARDRSATAPLCRQNFQTWERKGASYRKLPIDWPLAACTGRDAFCRSLLNDTWASISDNSESQARATNYHEEQLLRIEDVRYEWDIRIGRLQSLLLHVESIIKQVATMPLQRRRYASIKPSAFTDLHADSLRLLFGENAASQVLSHVCASPLTSLPVVHNTLLVKLQQWKAVRQLLDSSWRQQEAPHWDAALDFRRKFHRTSHNGSEDAITHAGAHSRISTVQASNTNNNNSSSRSNSSGSGRSSSSSGSSSSSSSSGSSSSSSSSGSSSSSSNKKLAAGGVR